MKLYFLNLLKGIKNSFKDNEVRVLLVIVLFSIIFGGLFYYYFEGWSFFDAIYFSVITLTTIGFGDIYPVTFAGKLFTIFYVFIGIGIIFLFINKIASNAIKEYPTIKVIEKKPSIKKEIKKEEKKMQRKIKIQRKLKEQLKEIEGK